MPLWLWRAQVLVCLQVLLKASEPGSEKSYGRGPGSEHLGS